MISIRPQLRSSKAVVSQSVASKPVASKSVGSKWLTSKSVVSKSVAPQFAAPQYTPKSGLPQPKSAQTDAEVCRALVQHHARTFSAASRFLPAEKRRAAFAVYAFCRVADDFVDEALRGSVEAGQDLVRHRVALNDALEGRAETSPFRELVWAIDRYNIPPAPFHALIDMLGTDLGPVVYDSWEELEAYCGGVASTVGEMCAYVFGLPGATAARDESLRRARVLGVALQMTNILRDVGEDAARGRCYLPVQDLARFLITRDEVLGCSILDTDPRWRNLMRFEIERTRVLYAEAELGIRSLDRDAQCCALICASGYAAILSAIERRRYGTLSGRAHIGAFRKALVMLRAWRTTRFATPVAAHAEHQSQEKHAVRA